MSKVSKSSLFQIAAVTVALATSSISLSQAQSVSNLKPSKNSRITSRNASSAPARVEHVIVRGTPDAIEVEIETSGPPLSPDTQVLTAPDRILVDFPGAIPAAELNNLRQHLGAVKSVRAGLFFRKPPITRVVIDLATPLAYQVVTKPSAPDQNTYLIRLGTSQAALALASSSIAGSVNAASGNSAKKSAPARRSAATLKPALASGLTTAPNIFGAAKLRDVANASSAPITTPHAESAITTAFARDNVVAAEANEQQPPSVAEGSPAPKSTLVVTFENGVLRIHADQSTMAEVLYEVQRQTQAEIAIPAGAEQEKVVADIGPGSTREVLGTLLNGSPYNFIFVGSEDKMEQVILTPREGTQ